MFEGKTYQILLDIIKALTNDLPHQTSISCWLSNNFFAFLRLASAVLNPGPRCTHCTGFWYTQSSLVVNNVKQLVTCCAGWTKWKNVHKPSFEWPQYWFSNKNQLKCCLLQELNWPPLFRVCGGIFCDELPFTCFVVSQILDHVCSDRDDFREKSRGSNK